MPPARARRDFPPVRPVLLNPIEYGIMNCAMHERFHPCGNGR